MRGQWIRRIERRPTADRVQQVRRQRQVQHLLENHTLDDLDCLRVGSLDDRVQRAQIRWQRRMLHFHRGLQMRPQIAQRVNRHPYAARDIADDARSTMQENAMNTGDAYPHSSRIGAVFNTNRL